jgi:hypothetical protein
MIEAGMVRWDRPCIYMVFSHETIVFENHRRK